MTQRSILAGQAPTVVVRANGSVTVEGWESERLRADSDNRWGLRIERRKAADIGRERALAAVGDRVLFDVSFDNPFNRSRRALQGMHGEVIEVQIGDGHVRVPISGDVIVYAGRGAEVRHLRGRVTASAGRDLKLRDVQLLAHAAAGADLDIECAALEGDELRFGAGRDLRFYVRDLTDATMIIKDLGSHWEAILGNGQIHIWLTAGGDVTLVTDQEVKAQPPYYLLGNIERPPTVTDGTETSPQN